MYFHKKTERLHLTLSILLLDSKKNNPIEEQTMDLKICFQKRHTNGQHTHEEVPNIISQMQIKPQLHARGMARIKKKVCWRGRETLEPVRCWGG